MEIEKIITLINTVSQSNIASFSIEEDHFKLSMNKVDQNQTVQIVQKPAVEIATIEVPNVKSGNIVVTSEVNDKVETNTDTKLIEIKSPIVGTFYSSSSPDADNFVKVGDHVKKGQIVCIIEAMKLLNDIESDYEGEVVEILAKNEQMVEYNQPLFRIKLA